MWVACAENAISMWEMTTNFCPAPLALLDSEPGLGSAGMWEVHPQHLNSLSLSPLRCLPSLSPICGGLKLAFSFSKQVRFCPTCCLAPAGTGTSLVSSCFGPLPCGHSGALSCLSVQQPSPDKPVLPQVVQCCVQSLLLWPMAG